MLSLLIAIASVAFYSMPTALARLLPLMPARDFTFTGPCATAAERPSQDAKFLSFLQSGPGTGQLLMAIEAYRSQEGC